MIRCCFHNCEQPAAVLIVNTEHDTFPFATGAGTVCEPHAAETLSGHWPCARVAGWPKRRAA
jgi:hypothetical protein